MDYIWTPWRYNYITTADKAPECIFCRVQTLPDEEARIVLRAEHCFVVLNTYPYTSGHVMVVPYQHLAQLQQLPTAAASEMIALAQRLEGVLRELYNPDGLNMGMNIGKAAGAGVAAHVHMHILPRWIGDAGFMSTAGETRVLPEALETTWKRIREKLR